MITVSDVSKEANNELNHYYRLKKMQKIAVINIMRMKMGDQRSRPSA